MANKKNIKVRDLKPTKDAKGGGAPHLSDHKGKPGIAGNKGTPVQESSKGQPFGGSI